MNCIIIFRSTVSLDDILPLILELKKADIISSPLFIAWDKPLFKVIKQNHVLYAGIVFIGGELRYLGKFNNRYINQFYNLFVLRDYIFKKILSIEYKTGNRLVSFLAGFNRRVWKGRRIFSMIFNRPFRAAKNHMKYYQVVQGKHKVQEKTIKGYDCILLSHLKEQVEEIQNLNIVSNSPVIQVGFTRGLEEWQVFLNKQMEKYIPDQIKPPYFFFVLNQLGAFLKGEDCPPADELLKESLIVLKEFNKDILTVFKPHYNTDVDGFKKILNDIGYRNYQISYLHPWILIKKAKFTFSYTGSSLLLDACFLGCPSVEYAHYDSRFYRINHGQPRYLDYVDYFIHRDVQQLRKVFQDLIYNNITIKRDPQKIKEDFPILTTQEIKEKFIQFVKI